MTTNDQDGNEVPIIGTYVAAAGKDYSCDGGCGKLIYKGERYLRIVIKPQGKFMSQHYHYACA